MKRYMDIKLPTNRLEAFSFWQNNLRAELISILLSSKKIKVTSDSFENVFKHNFQPGYKRGLCYCDSCYGDFSNGGNE